MPVEKKFALGILLARDMPAEYEEEALKARQSWSRTEVQPGQSGLIAGEGTEA